LARLDCPADSQQLTLAHSPKRLHILQFSPGLGKTNPYFQHGNENFIRILQVNSILNPIFAKKIFHLRFSVVIKAYLGRMEQKNTQVETFW
jgi:hypothetical protein